MLFVVPFSYLRNLLLVVAILGVSPAVAREVPPANLDAAAAALQQHVDAGHLAGAVLMVSQHNEVRAFEAMGYQDLENQIPMQTDTIFRIYSMTKPVAGVALMTLYDDGRFKLDDPVEKYIPEFAGLQVAATDGPDGNPVTEPPHHKMTIRELMSHTGGLTYGFFSQSQVDSLYQRAGVLDRNSTLKQMVAKLGKIPLWAQPGTVWHYSVSVDVQGYLVEVLSGMAFDDYLQQRIFDPLMMRDTGFYVPAADAGRLARYYAVQDGQLVSQPNSEYLQQPALLSGGGGLVSTAYDYMQFARMLVNDGQLNGVRILSAEAVNLMRSNQLAAATMPSGGFMDPGNAFGLDFAVVEDADLAFGPPAGSHWWFGIAGTWFWIDPVNDLIFIGMIQHRDVRQSIGIHRQSKALIYAD